MMGRLSPPIEEHHSRLKALPIAVSPGFHSQQHNPPPHFRLILHGTWRSGLFPVVLATFSIMETSLLAACAAISDSHCVFPRSMVCSRYPLPVLSAPSTGSPASSAHAAISAFPAWIRSSIYRCTTTGSEFPLPDADFQQEDADVHSGGFYPPPHPVVSPHESDLRLFSQPHWVSALM